MQKRTLLTIPISFSDLTILVHVIDGYLAYLRGAVALSQKYVAEIQRLQSLRTRLVSVPPKIKELPFLLTTAEIEALDSAIEGFMVLYRRNHPPLKDRDVLLKQFGEFRQDLARMLSFDHCYE